MAREKTWLSKLKSQLSHSKFNIIHPTTLLPKDKAISSSNVGVLAFEIAALISKLLALHQSLSDKAIVRLKNDVISLEGVRKLVSNDDSFLLNLACAEMVQTIHIVSKHVFRFGPRCCDPAFRSFLEVLNEFANSGKDTHGWAAMSPKDFDALARRADRYIAATSALYREIEELTLLENSLRKKSPGKESSNSSIILELQQKIVWQKQEVKQMKEKSLWNRSYDTAMLLMAKLIFSILWKIKFMFGLSPNVTLSRSLSTSATVFPATSDLNNSAHHPNQIQLYILGPLKPIAGSRRAGNGFFECRTKALTPPSSTLGAAALALHYANLIIVLEKMIKSPHLVGLDAREDVYGMLPSSIRSLLRSRLKGRVGFIATDPVLAEEWKDALTRILAWLAPLAHNMIKWQNERSFEQHNLTPKHHNVLLLQTLYFANRDKTEAAITELLVGLNYIWRFEREMNARALLECSNFFFNRNNNHNNLQI